MRAKIRFKLRYGLSLFIAVWLFYVYLSTLDVSEENLGNVGLMPVNAGSKYLIHTSTCKIPDVAPFNNDIKPYFKRLKYISCRTINLLTYLTSNNGTVTLHINKTLIPTYSRSGVTCCYQGVTRDNKNREDPDSAFELSECKEFNNWTILEDDAVIVRCRKKNTNWNVYKNIHAAVPIKENVRKKLEDTKKSTNALSVLIVGIDTMSRLNFIRTMPQTRQKLQEDGWVELKGYTKIGDNTFPNVGALLTGLDENAIYKQCRPEEVGKLDECGLIWYDFRKNGYVTAFAEDEGRLQTFNYYKKGFVNPPTDYYFRPYILAAEYYLKTFRIDSTTYCLGPESAGDRLLNLANVFATTFKDHPNFGLFWINTFSHNNINSATRMDGKILDIVRKLEDNGVLDQTMVILCSDHGFRYGGYRLTHSGWLEDRLPFFYVWVPKWFREQNPSAYKHLQTNSDRLTTPFDVYMTFQDVLARSRNYTIKPSGSCPKCKSLFEEMGENRTCEDAGLPHHWCACGGYQAIDHKHFTAQMGAQFILGEIEKTIQSRGPQAINCAKFKLTKIVYCGVTEFSADKQQSLLMIIHTAPGAMFEATLDFVLKGDKPVFTLQGSISRVDYYGDYSTCVQDAILKKYCFCKSWYDFLTWLTV